ncbi:MAG TPA: hypothetical protein VIT23_08215, partial [Terrimicrobiaceae bacterium]
MRLNELGYAMRDALAFPARIANAWRLSEIRRNLSRSPIVSFGGVLARGGLIHGGAIKLLHLRAAFDTNEKSFNLLYLVSSTPPIFAEDLLNRCQRLGISFVWNQNGVAYPGWAGKDVKRHNEPMRRLRTRADYV